tara:strand:- start:108432 stop:109349 length:918 start_codon:yes stop_codon:yes gene_type:complete
MSNRHLAILGITTIAAAAILFLLRESDSTNTDISDTQPTDIEAPQNNEPDEIVPATTTGQNNAVSGNTELTQSQVQQALTEIRSRQQNDQTDPAFDDLSALAERYDDMSHEEKRSLLTDYATHFLRNGQYEDARYFYEQVLQLPGLEHTNRLAVLQMLARIAMAAEDWEGFLAYNDQYFDVGGGYNWIVTGHLMRAFQQLENHDAAGEALLIHFETGLFPQYDGSDGQYERLYGNIDAIPLDMSDHQSAVLVAEKLAEQFDRPENWRVLSEVYSAAGDTTNYNQVIQAARAKGLMDSAGSWLVDP